MGLAERERAAVARELPRQKCLVQTIAASLDQEDADALHRLIYDRRDLTASQVEEIVSEEGIDLHQNNITRHRRGGCRSCKQKG